MVRLTVLAMLLCVAIGARAEFTASVDRRVIDENDVVVLELRRDAQVFVGNPDLSALDTDFKVLGTQRASQFTIANGRTQSVTTWTVTLQPKRRGALRIPSLEYDGERTQPITITVTQPSPEEVAALERTVFFETDVSKGSIWVQEQLLYTVRLYYASDAVLFGDLPPPPTIANTVIQPLGDSRPGVEVREGVRYNVIEQRYALVPQRSGTLSIPGESFTGAVRIAARGATRRKNIRVVSDGHRIEVKAQPATWPDGIPWLPARALTLEQRWEPTPPRFVAGEPATRTIELVARGIAASTLPEISYAPPGNARTYDNQPALDEGLATGDFIATRIESTVIIPERPGVLTLPEVRVPWFDVERGEMRIAAIPAQRFDVAAPSSEPGERGNASTPDAMKTVPGASTEPAIQPAPAPRALTREIGPFDVALPWRALALAFAALWILTLAIWWLFGRRSGSSSEREARGTPLEPAKAFDQHRGALLDACARDDAAAARRHIGSWRRQATLDAETRVRLDALVAKLDEALYAPASADWQGAELAAIVKRAKSSANGTDAHRPADPLPPLHPRP